MLAPSLMTWIYSEKFIESDFIIAQALYVLTQAKIAMTSPGDKV